MRKLVYTILWAILIVLLSCKSNIDTQPPASVGIESGDSVIIIPLESLPDAVVEEIIIESEPISTDSLLASIYLSQVGVREATGNNDGKEVEMYLRATGLGKGYAWCAAFVRWGFDSAGVKTTITAWSPTAENKNNYVLKKGTWEQDLRRGDVFTLYFPRLKRIGHTGFAHKKFGVKSIQTVEGNTGGLGPDGDREGDGMYIKLRPVETIHSITRWF